MWWLVPIGLGLIFASDRKRAAQSNQRTAGPALAPLNIAVARQDFKGPESSIDQGPLLEFPDMTPEEPDVVETGKKKKLKPRAIAKQAKKAAKRAAKGLQ